MSIITGFVDILEAHLKQQNILETGKTLVYMTFMLNDPHL